MALLSHNSSADQKRSCSKHPICFLGLLIKLIKHDESFSRFDAFFTRPLSETFVSTVTFSDLFQLSSHYQKLQSFEYGNLTGIRNLTPFLLLYQPPLMLYCKSTGHFRYPSGIFVFSHDENQTMHCRSFHLQVTVKVSPPPPSKILAFG